MASAMIDLRVGTCLSKVLIMVRWKLSLPSICKCKVIALIDLKSDYQSSMEGSTNAVNLIHCFADIHFKGAVDVCFFGVSTCIPLKSWQLWYKYWWCYTEVVH